MTEQQSGAGATFARRMREERAGTGVSQNEIAERISHRLGYKVDGSSVTRMEAGTRKVRIEEAVAIAAELGVPLSALLRDRSALDEEIDRLHDDLTLAEWRVSKTENELRKARESMHGIKGRLAELESERGD